MNQAIRMAVVAGFLTGCTMTGGDVSKIPDKHIKCVAINNPGLSFSYWAHNIKNYRIGIGADSVITFVDDDGIERTLTSGQADNFLCSEIVKK